MNSKTLADIRHRANLDMRQLQRDDAVGEWSAPPSWEYSAKSVLLACKHIESLEEEIRLLRTFIDKIAGPVGSGCDIGSRQQMAQQYRELADRVRAEREKS